jgi:hypothetical protein
VTNRVRTKSSKEDRAAWFLINAFSDDYGFVLGVKVLEDEHVIDITRLLFKHIILVG